MRRTTLIVVALAIAVSMVALTGADDTHAQLFNDTSHLKLTSSASHGSPGTHVDQVINNDIDVKITITDPISGYTDWGVLALRPGSTPNHVWYPVSTTHNFFLAVNACDQAGGCAQGDVESWLIWVQVAAGLSSSSYVRYDIDSDDLGNGYRHHVSPADCDTLVTPKDDTYDATDGQPGWDAARYCTDAGVSINLDYEE